MKKKKLLKKAVVEHFEVVGKCTTKERYDEFKEGFYYSQYLEDFIDDTSVVLSESDMVQIFFSIIEESPEFQRVEEDLKEIKKLVIKLWNKNKLFIPLDFLS